MGLVMTNATILNYACTKGNQPSMISVGESVGKVLIFFRPHYAHHATMQAPSPGYGKVLVL